MSMCLCVQLAVTVQVGLQDSACGRILSAKVDSHQSAPSSTSAANTVPGLTLSSMTAFNKVSKPLSSAGVMPRVRFQLDSSKFPSIADPGRNALGDADAEAGVTSELLSAISTPAGNGDAEGTVGLLQSSLETEKSALYSKKQGREVVDSLAGGASSSVEMQSLLEHDSTAVHGASAAQNSVDLETEGVICSVQLGDDRHQESCTSHKDCAESLSEEHDIATMIESMRRRFTVTEFQFAHAGYAARQALNAVHD